MCYICILKCTKILRNIDAHTNVNNIKLLVCNMCMPIVMYTNHIINDGYYLGTIKYLKVS